MKFFIAFVMAASLSSVLFADGDWGCEEGDKYSTPTIEIPTSKVYM